jgi:histidine ammonia-lyase
LVSSPFLTENSTKLSTEYFSPCPSTGLDEAGLVLQKNGLKPISLKAKEGLALINGTQMITALGAVEKAKYLALQADIIAALTCEVLKENDF